MSDCNQTRTHNHLVHKRTLNHLAKLDLKEKKIGNFINEDIEISV